MSARLSSNSKSTDAQRRWRSIAAVASLVPALGFWYVVFVVPAWNFWAKMSVATVVLALVGVLSAGAPARRGASIRPRHFVVGVASAVVLYGVFWLGKIVLVAVSAEAQGAIGAVYETKHAVPEWLVALLLLFVTSPCEEIYWRGFIQRQFMGALGKPVGFGLATLCYTGVHIVTLNVPLILASFTAGAVWGWIYMREQSLVPGIISHSLWATLIFVVVPVA